MMFLVGLALLAIRDATRPALFFYMLKAGIIVRKLAEEVLEAVPQVLRYRLLCHDVFHSLVLKGQLRAVFTSLATVINELVLVWASSEAGEWKDRILEIPL